MAKNVPDPFFLLQRWLWRRDVRDALVRTILVWQICIAVLTLVSGGATALFWSGGHWLFWFGCGSAIAAWNFYALAKFVQNLIPGGWSVSILVRLLVNANIRLLLSGALIFGAFVWGGAPLSALLLGVASLLAGITAAGLKKALKKPD